MDDIVITELFFSHSEKGYSAQRRPKASKEMTEGTVSVRRQGGKDEGCLKAEDFAAMVTDEVKAQLS